MVWYSIGVCVMSRTFNTWPLGDTKFVVLSVTKYFTCSWISNLRHEAGEI